MIPYYMYRRAVEQLYEDRAIIKRYVEERTEWGETRLIEKEVERDIPCRISQRALGVNRQTETVNEIAYETKLLLPPDIEVRQGDIIEVTRRGVTRKYTAGEPFLYPTHQEVSIQRRDEA